jgi:hypothetical protein
LDNSGFPKIKPHSGILKATQFHSSRVHVIKTTRILSRKKHIYDWIWTAHIYLNTYPSNNIGAVHLENMQMVNIDIVKLSSVLPLVWTEPAAKTKPESTEMKDRPEFSQEQSLAQWMPTLDQQPFTTTDYDHTQQDYDDSFFSSGSGSFFASGSFFSSAASSKVVPGTRSGTSSSLS